MSTVNLRVYDISGGAAKKWSSILIGRQIQGVWHSGIEVFGFEYFYGGGIVKMRPENVELTFGISPTCIHDLGETQVTRVEFEKFLISAMPLFRKEVYNLTEWNCNHFTNYCSQQLLGRRIPQYILDLPREVCKTFMGKLILNFLKMIGGNAPVAIDDPKHPSKAGLPAAPSRVQSERVNRMRRNSCPASPTRASSSSLGRPKKPVAVTAVATSGLSAASSIPKRPAVVGSTSRRLVLPQLDEKQVVLKGSPIAANGRKVETEVLFSPTHKRLYELERDFYASPAKPSAHRNRRQSAAAGPMPLSMID